MTRDEILNIKKSEYIFSEEEELCRKQYKKFAKYYHPEEKNGDQEVFEHLTKLYHDAIDRITNSDRKWSHDTEFILDNGQSLRIEYQMDFSFELGTCYVCRDKVLYVLGKDKGKYYNNYLERVRNISFADTKMKKIFERQIPKVQMNGKLNQGDFFIIVEKTRDVFPLKAVQLYLKSDNGRHLAWVISRLSSLVCFLEYNNIVHNGIDVNSCFISPEHHAIVLLGGWWYTVNIGHLLIGTTKEIYDLMPVVAKTKKIADTSTDLESVKQVGRMLLEANTYQKVQQRTDIPIEIREFLTKGSSCDAIKEMHIWDKILDSSFGARKFIKLNLIEEQVYSGKGE